MGKLASTAILLALVTTVASAQTPQTGAAQIMSSIPSNSVTRAFLLIQFVMLLLLIPRFWQRGIAVSYWQQRMLVPVVEVHPVEPTVVPLATAPEPAAEIPAEPGRGPDPAQET